MNFLLINQFFAPDPAPTGQLLADVARALVADGHSVRVLCSRSSYAPSSQIGDGGLEAIEIRRVGSVSFGRSRLARLPSYAAFFLSALFHIIFHRRPDIILTLTTPPLLSLVGTLGKRLRGSRHLIWEMDIYPDIAVEVGVIRSGGAIDRVIGALADFSRHQADEIITLGRCMADRLEARGIPAAKISVAENWADGDFVAPRPFPTTGPLVLLYSGNLGRAHDVETIAAAAHGLAHPEHFRLIFAGGGRRRARLEQASVGLRHMEFLPYQPHAALPHHLGRCHVGLVTQNAATSGCVVPSKTYALMAAGRPFIFIGPRDATPAHLIERFHCGWHVEPGDAAGLVALMEMLQSRPELVREAGERARHAFLSYGGLPAGTARILTVLTSGVLEPGPAKSAAAGA